MPPKHRQTKTNPSACVKSYVSDPDDLKQFLSDRYLDYGLQNRPDTEIRIPRSRLWYLGAQALCTYLDQFPDLKQEYLESVSTRSTQTRPIAIVTTPITEESEEIPLRTRRLEAGSEETNGVGISDGNSTRTRSTHRKANASASKGSKNMGKTSGYDGNSAMQNLSAEKEEEEDFNVEDFLKSKRIQKSRGDTSGHCGDFENQTNTNETDLSLSLSSSSLTNSNVGLEDVSASAQDPIQDRSSRVDSDPEDFDVREFLSHRRKK